MKKEFIDYVPYITAFGLFVLGIGTLLKDRETLQMDREKHSLETELISLQIKSLQQNEPATT